MEKPEPEAVTPKHPNLQELVRQYGGYDKVTPEAWAQYDREFAEWQTWRREGLLYHGK